MKKYRPLRELFISLIIFLLFLVLLEYLSSDIELEIKKIRLNLGLFIFYLIIYVLPTIILFFNYNTYIKKREMDYTKIVENDINKLILVATRDKIKDRPSVYSLPYHMNFFYLKIYIKNKEEPILVTSLDEYKIEKWINNKYHSIRLEKEIYFFPYINY